MTIIRAKEVRKLNDSEYESKMSEIQKELMKLNAQRSSGSTPENVGKIRALKRAVARMLTIKKEGGIAKKQ